MPDPDWDPQSEAALDDPEAAYDAMRQRCPVAWSERLGWSLFRHADVLRVLEDHETFSNAVSRHRSVPNGMDPPEHTAYREAIEPFFGEERIRRFEPVCRDIATALLQPLAVRGSFECMEDFAIPFALRCQCDFLGWPRALAEPVRVWTRRSTEATRAGHRATLVAVAREFREQVGRLLEARRAAGASAPGDVIAELMQARVGGSPLTDDDIASILRNWTVGELGSIAAGIGILAHRLAAEGILQDRLRADPSLLPAAIDEILRISGPLVLNRRVATRDVTVGGRPIKAGEPLSLLWISANRDERVFDRPHEVRPDRDPGPNLLYGAGIHVCPGAPLARLELRIAMETLLAGSGHLGLGPQAAARRAAWPANGWRALPLEIG